MMRFASRAATQLLALRNKLPIGRDEARLRDEVLRKDLEELRLPAAVLEAQVHELQSSLGAQVHELRSSLDSLAANQQRQVALLEHIARSDEVNRQSAGIPRPGQVYFGLDDLDRKLEEFLDFDGGFFVELGANDGVSQSNTLYFERSRGWSGILVEPTPHNFLACLANRARRTRVFCNACVSFDYTEKFVEIAFSNLMSTPLGLDTDIGDPIAHARAGLAFMPPRHEVFSFGALATPLNTLLVEGGAPSRIDLLSLDVEGAEMEVLKGIDHDAYRFRYLCVECRSPERLSEYLRGVGYRLVKPITHHDFLFEDAG